MSSFKLCQIKINGCKCIDKELVFDFSNSTLSDDMKITPVKAIYGPNGAGKTGLISAMYIYDSLTNNKNGLNNDFLNTFVVNTINKDINKLSIIVTFALVSDNDNKKPLILRHEILLSKKENNDVKIDKECILKLNKQTIRDDHFKECVLALDKQITRLNGLDVDKNNPLYLKSLNLLDHVSIVSLDYSQELNNDEKSLDDNLYWIILTKYFARRISVYIESCDLHSSYINTSLLQSNVSRRQNFIKYVNGIAKDLESSDYYNYYDTDDIVPVEQYESYCKNVTELSDFIKIFKPSLKEIEVDNRLNGDVYICKKNCVYQNNVKVNIEFESTGIKKLIKLFSLLKRCTNGAIVFIDELDANLHDVYFTKLIEFILYNAKGQLIFTTHNVDPIDILKDRKYTIEFVSANSKKYLWTKDGNISPKDKYVRGLIPNNSFNVESYDFNVLLEDDKNEWW